MILQAVSTYNQAFISTLVEKKKELENPYL